MKRRKINRKLLIITLILFISVGFAYLTSSLTINGIATIKRSVWDVHFENVINENENVLTVNTPAVISNNKLRIDYEVTLDQPGQEYSFYVDVVNKSTFDVMVDTVTISGLTSTQEVWIKPTITYSDGIAIQHNDTLKESNKETLKVSIKYIEDLTANTLPSIDTNFSITIEIKYNQADSNSKERSNIEYLNRQVEGAITIGDEISIGTEHFYILSSNEEKTVLLSKYNLYVGSIYSSSTSKISDIDINAEKYGLQSEEAKGWNQTENRIGTIKFSNEKYWYNNGLLSNYGSSYPAYVYDETKNTSSGSNYSIAYYVENYGNYLANIGLNYLKIRLISQDEVYNCQSGGICTVLLYNYRFMCNYTYWTGFITDENSICGIGSDCGFNCYDYSTTLSGTFGVRPVIEIPTNIFQQYKTITFNPNGGTMLSNSTYTKSISEALEDKYYKILSVNSAAQASINGGSSVTSVEEIADSSSPTGKAIRITKTEVGNSVYKGCYFRSARPVITGEPYYIEELVKCVGEWRIGNERIITWNVKDIQNYRLESNKGIALTSGNTIAYNSGQRKDDTIDIAYIDLYHLLPEVDREGYTFTGWYTEPDGGTRITKDTIVTKNTTYYAHWTEN